MLHFVVVDVDVVVVVVVCKQPVIVPNPNSSNEDDGALLSMVFDSNANSTSIIILDSKTMTTLAEIPLPNNIPFHFHGIFCPKNTTQYSPLQLQCLQG